MLVAKRSAALPLRLMLRQASEDAPGTLSQGIPSGTPGRQELHLCRL